VRKWNEDPFTKKARRENFEARSVYKLKEIDDREKLFRPSTVVLDLGAAPGSWTQYALQKTKTGRVISVDISPLNVTDARLTFLQIPIEEVDLVAVLGEQKVDLVLSDMAPKTSGIHDRDTALSFELASAALGAAKKHLKIGGHFVVKLFMGSEFEQYQKEMRAHFETVKLLRPESTRKQSREIFFIGKNFRSKT
jgi:23S rRNA (uridine2552-2'-O)-methyltransferase